MTSGQEEYKKMLKILKQQRNANWNHSEVYLPPHIHYNGYYPEQQKTNVDDDVQIIKILNIKGKENLKSSKRKELQGSSYKTMS